MHKILLVSNNFPNPADPNRGVFTLQLVKELQRRADVTVVSPLPWFPRWLDYQIFSKWRHYSQVPNVYEIDGVTVISPKYFFIPKVAEPLHAALMFVRILPLLLKLRRNVGIDILNAHWLYPDGISVGWCARVMRLPFILSALGCDVNEFLNERFKRAQIISSLKSASHIVTVSRDLTDKLIEVNLPVSKISTIPNGVNSDIFFQDNRSTSRRDESEKRQIVFVGRLSEEKDVGILLEAILLLKGSRQDFHLTIVGDGPERKELEEYSESNGLDNSVTFCGEVRHSQVSVYLRQCDVFCLPSKREGCPNVVLEALASGVPVVAFTVGGIPDIVTSNTGILVDSRTPRDLMAALDEALSLSWNKSEIVGSVRELTWDKSAARYLDVFNQVLSKTHES